MSYVIAFAVFVILFPPQEYGCIEINGIKDKCYKAEDLRDKDGFLSLDKLKEINYEW